jgi:hypothetical protein
MLSAGERDQSPAGSSRVSILLERFGQENSSSSIDRPARIEFGNRDIA